MLDWVMPLVSAPIEYEGYENDAQKKSVRKFPRGKALN